MFLETRKPAYKWKDPEWAAWYSAFRRCTSPRDPSWDSYGGRGVSVCDRWVSGDGAAGGYDCFLADMGRRPTPTHSLERINVNGDYEPLNCCWLPMALQASNTRQVHRVVFNGAVYTATSFARRVGLPPKCVLRRLELGWSVEDIASRPAGWRPSKYQRRAA